MEKPALVASDVDGTLLGSDEQVSEHTATVVRRVIATETPFVLVTGRPPRWVPRVAEAAGATGYAICANGAILYDVSADEVLWQRAMDPQRLSDLASVLDTALPDCHLAAERVGRKAEDIQPFVTEEGYLPDWPENLELLPRAELLGRPAVKLLVRNPHMTSAEMAAAVEELLRDEFSVTYSTNAGMLEIAERDVTKATGLSELACRLGKTAQDVIAFGDMPNDIEMLKWAGHGVAMANAHPDVLEVADEITGTNDQNGVAMVLERWF